MILLKKFQEATECVFCRKTKDGYDAECQLGTFSGHICLVDLQKQMSARRNAKVPAYENGRVTA